MATSAYTFEILCVDKSGDTVVRKVENLKHALLANASLWQDAKPQGESEIIDTNLKVSISSTDSEDVADQQLKHTFIIRVKGDFDETERFRIPLVDYIHQLKFAPIYVVSDEISEKIAGKLYPGIHQIENKLRGYLIKFFVKKLGPDWWKVTADADMNRKARDRNVESRVLTNSLDSSAYLIDFGDLGRIVYQQISGFLSRDDIIKRIRSMDESGDSVRMLKEEIETNYTKFFNDVFREKDFQKKWEELEKIRHKVAHANLFTQEQCDYGMKLIEELLEIIEDADTGIAEIQFSDYERDTLRESIVEHSAFAVITEREFMQELWQLYDEYKIVDRFVGLTYFVRRHLGVLGYDFSSSYEIISSLEKRGLIEVYKVDNPLGDYQTSAIKPIGNRELYNSGHSSL